MANFDPGESALFRIIKHTLPPGTPIEVIMAVRNRVASELAAFLNSMKLPPITLANWSDTPSTTHTVSYNTQLVVAYDPKTGIIYRNSAEDQAYPYTYSFQSSTNGAIITYTTDDGKAIVWVNRRLYDPVSGTITETLDITDLPTGTETLALALANAVTNPTPQALQAVNEAKRALIHQAEQEWRSRLPQLFIPHSALHQPSRKPLVYRRRYW